MRSKKKYPLARRANRSLFADRSLFSVDQKLRIGLKKKDPLECFLPSDAASLRRVRVEVVGTDYNKILNLGTLAGWRELAEVLWQVLVDDLLVDDTPKMRTKYAGLIQSKVRETVYLMLFRKVNDEFILSDPWVMVMLTRLPDRNYRKSSRNISS